MTAELPPREEVLAKFKELLDAGKIDEAAKLLVYYTVATADPEEVARRLREAAQEYSARAEKKL